MTRAKKDEAVVADVKVSDPAPADAATDPAPAADVAPGGDVAAPAGDGPSDAPADPQNDDAADPAADAEAAAEAEKQAADARAAALAALKAPGSVEPELTDDEHEDEDEPAMPAVTGRHHDWGGARYYVVTGTVFNAIVNGTHHTAWKGDAVKATKAVAERGITLGMLAGPIDADD